jgi:hypothetical protein
MAGRQMRHSRQAAQGGPGTQTGRTVQSRQAGSAGYCKEAVRAGKFRAGR